MISVRCLFILLAFSPCFAEAPPTPPVPIQALELTKDVAQIDPKSISFDSVEAVATPASSSKDSVKAGEETSKKSLSNLSQPVSHEAEYSVEFVPIKGASGDMDDQYMGARGKMSFQMVRVDSNWITKQTSFLREAESVGEASDGSSVTSTILNTCEGDDGMSYEFTAQAMRDGEVEEEIGGRGRLVSVDGPGTVVYENPEAQTINLPHGSVFPITHLKMLLSKALGIKGKNFEMVKAYVFDGSNDVREAVRIHAIIAPVDTKKREVISSDKSLYKADKLWRAEMSVFTSESSDDIPDYKVVQIFSDQGVIHEFRVNYGSYEMVSKLTNLKVYKEGEAAKTLRLISITAMPENESSSASK